MTTGATFCRLHTKAVGPVFRSIACRQATAVSVASAGRQVVSVLNVPGRREGKPDGVALDAGVAEEPREVNTPVVGHAVIMCRWPVVIPADGVEVGVDGPLGAEVRSVVEMVGVGRGPGAADSGERAGRE